VDIRLRRRFCRLPLTSELDALCAANANQTPLPSLAELGSSEQIQMPKERKKTLRVVIVGRGTLGIRYANICTLAAYKRA